jgi:lipoate-protein ligase A
VGTSVRCLSNDSYSIIEIANDNSEFIQNQVHKALSHLNYLEWTAETPEENLACDEALLQELDRVGGLGTLRIWEPRSHFIVLGRGNRYRKEISPNSGTGAPYPLYRRCTGGGSVLLGPGCLNFSLIIPRDPATIGSTVQDTNWWIMQKQANAVSKTINKVVTIEGHTDLAWNGRKFSGNSQRRMRKAILFHGSFLLDFNLALVEEALGYPPLTPDYRHSRPHSEFLVNLQVESQLIKTALKNEWKAHARTIQPPIPAIQSLVSSRYSQEDWNFSR